MAISISTDELLDAALALPALDRAQLAEELVASLATEEFKDAEAQRIAAWEAEIRRRIDDVRSGKSQLIDGDVVMREFRERFAK